MRKVQTAAREFEQAMTQTAGVAPRQPATRVVIDPPIFKMSNFLWVGSKGAAGFVGQAAMVLFLTFFLLLSGNTYKRKLVRLTGPSLSNKKIAMHILDDINASIREFLTGIPW